MSENIHKSYFIAECKCARAQLSVGGQGEKERKIENKRETERCGYESLRVAHQHSKYLVEGGRGSSQQKRNKNLPRERDVALIFIREKRGCCAEGRERTRS